MKTRKYIYTTLATCLFVFSSCLNDYLLAELI